MINLDLNNKKHLYIYIIINFILIGILTSICFFVKCSHIIWFVMSIYLLIIANCFMSKNSTISFTFGTIYAILITICKIKYHKTKISISTMFTKIIPNIFLEDVVTLICTMILLNVLIIIIEKYHNMSILYENIQTSSNSILKIFMHSIFITLLGSIDDYFCILLLSNTICKILLNKNVNKKYVAILINALAVSFCILNPFSSWGLTIISQFEKNSELIKPNKFICSMYAFCFNFFAISLLIIIYILIYKKYKNIINTNNTNTTNKIICKNNKSIIHTIWPIMLLYALCIFFVLTNIGNKIELLLSCSITIIVLILYNKIHILTVFKDIIYVLQSFKFVFLTLSCASLLRAIVRDKNLLNLEQIMKEFVGKPNMTNYLIYIPTIIFILCCLLSYSLGSSWSTFYVTISIVQILIQNMNYDNWKYNFLCLSSCIAGSSISCYCSPMSDTVMFVNYKLDNDLITQSKYQLKIIIYSIMVSSMLYLSLSKTCINL